MRGSIRLAILFVLFFSAPALAIGTAEQRANCNDDAFRFCNEQIPDAYAVEKCLRAHLSALSPACRAEFTDSRGKAKRH